MCPQKSLKSDWKTVLFVDMKYSNAGGAVFMTSICIAVDQSSGPVPLDQAVTEYRVEMYNEASCLTN